MRLRRKPIWKERQKARAKIFTTNSEFYVTKTEQTAKLLLTGSGAATIACIAAMSNLKEQNQIYSAISKFILVRA